MKRIITCLIAFACILTGAFGQKDGKDKVRPICGPYIQNPTTDGFTVVWESNMDAVAWVEIAPDDGTHFYNKDRTKYYDLRGFGNQVISTMHKIRVDGLEPGTTYRYRIMMKGVRLFDGPGTVKYTKAWGSDVYKKQPYRFTTPKEDYDRLRFDVYNDIHQQDSLMNLLTKGAGEPDFAVFNGDMVSSMAWKDKIREMYLATGARNLGGSVPLYLLRGNHEFRGKDSKHWFDYVDMPEGKPYFTASWGKFFFIFLDTCEDKPDNDIEYGGTMLSDPYLAAQARWLEGVVESDACRNAAARIVIGHIPPRKGGWHGDENVNSYFVPVLNKAGISLMITGHLHKWKIYEPGSVSDANFPVVVNSNCERLEVTLDKSDINLEAFAPDGSKTHSYSCKVR
jgi:3',5'-cyclic AMP phosphodiesterase CpdA